ncbi:hypothetical protein [Nocardioides litoris]|uniref:hypothetical protein n=1 Tax=Nocardioides litoris TaxID=1926648 RepID=UPI00111E4B93|nr:hypothetical protein [Nocardioides litoris]
MSDPSPHDTPAARPDPGWTEPAALGWAEAFRADPCPGGPPLVSADGHWWWTGELWQRRLPEPA